MTRTLRGGNNTRRVQRQKVHGFTMSEDEIDSADKGRLIEVAEDLGVLSEIPRNGKSSKPLVSDLRAHLKDLRGVQLT